MNNFLLSIFVLLVCSACSTMEFNTSGRMPFKVGAYIHSEKQVSVEATKDFFYWGMTPEHAEFNFQDETEGLGIYDPSNVLIEQRYTFSDVFYTFITLGLYCPVTYKITLLTNREVK